MEGAEGRAREATRRDPLAVYDRYRGGDRGRIKRSASEERMEQVREFDGEQAYEKMMRDNGGGQTREGQASGDGQGCGEGKAGVGQARDGKEQGAAWAGTRGAGAGLWPQPLVWSCSGGVGEWAERIGRKT